MKEDNFLIQFAPALLALIFSSIQAIYTILVKYFPKFNFVKQEHSKVPGEKWYDNSQFDDFICDILCASGLASMCFLGMTNFAWCLVAPIVFLGTMSSAFHLTKKAML